MTRKRTQSVGWAGVAAMTLAAALTAGITAGAVAQTQPDQTKAAQQKLLTAGYASKNGPGGDSSFQPAVVVDPSGARPSGASTRQIQYTPKDNTKNTPGG